MSGPASPPSRRNPGGFFYRRAVPEGIRITTVGLWYVLFTVLVAIAATNTGNNALYMVLALMFSLLIVSGVASRENVRGLEAEIDPPGEVFANRPFGVGFRLRSRALVFPRWFLLFTLSRSGSPLLIPYLPRRGKSVGQLEIARRGEGDDYMSELRLYVFRDGQICDALEVHVLRTGKPAATVDNLREWFRSQLASLT